MAPFKGDWKRNSSLCDMLLMKQSCLILEQKSPHNFHRRAGRGRFNYSSHKPDVQSHSKTLAVSVVYAHRWASAYHQGGGNRWKLNPPPPSQIHPQPHHILELTQLAHVVLKLPEHTARCQLCPRAPLTPYAHFSQLGMTLHLNSISVETPPFDTKSCNCLQYRECRGPTLHIQMQGGHSCIQSCCQVSTMASYQPVIDSLNSSAWSLL